jgi:YggT family protein
LELICTVLSIYSWIIFARILMSWVRVEPGTGLASVYSVLYNLTEPVLGPIRSVIPPMRMGVAALDLSPILVFVLILIIC